MATLNPTVDDAFVKEYESLAHIAYQRRGSHLRGTVRTKNGVKGESTTFQKIGKGTAGTKSRHGKVPVMNLNHTPVECTLTDHYAGEFVDKLDELKLNISEMEIAAASGAWALGRKTDELLVAAIETTSNSSAVSVLSDGVDYLDVAALVEEFGNNDVPDDGQRMAVIGWAQWGHLMQLDQFVSADYIGAESLPHKGTTSAKFWNTFMWMPFSGLTRSGGYTNCLFYHKTAVGHAIGADIMTDITWQGLYASHFIDNMMSQGAVLIDANACWQQNFNDTLS